MRLRCDCGVCVWNVFCVMWNAPARARLRSSGARLRFGGHSKVQTQWQVLTSNAALSGDVLFHQRRFRRGIGRVGGGRICRKASARTSYVRQGPARPEAPTGFRRRRYSACFERTKKDKFTMRRPKTHKTNERPRLAAPAAPLSLCT